MKRRTETNPERRVFSSDKKLRRRLLGHSALQPLATIPSRGSVSGEGAKYFFTKKSIAVVEEYLPEAKGVVIDITIQPLSDDV